MKKKTVLDLRSQKSTDKTNRNSRQDIGREMHKQIQSGKCNQAGQNQCGSPFFFVHHKIETAPQTRLPNGPMGRNSPSERQPAALPARQSSTDAGALPAALTPDYIKSNLKSARSPFLHRISGISEGLRKRRSAQSRSIPHFQAK